MNKQFQAPWEGFLGEGVFLAPQNHVTYFEAKLRSFVGESGVTQPLPILSGGNKVHPCAPGGVPTPPQLHAGDPVARWSGGSINNHL